MTAFMRGLVLLGLSVMPPLAHAHSASDAYLTLTTSAPSAGPTVIHGQWDVALRDLDFVLNLDANGDGRITWGEVRTRRAAIEKYVYRNIAFQGDGVACRIVPSQFRIADHADGAYAALSFDASCGGTPKDVALAYRLFFAIDPSHRAIVVWRARDDTATAVLAPENPRIAIGVGAP